MSKKPSAPDTTLAPHNKFHRRSKAGAAAQVGYAVLCGLELTRQRKIHRGDWEIWVEFNCEFSLRTAQRYVVLAENVGNQAKKAALVSLLEGAADAPLTEDQEAELLALVAKVADGATLTELYQDYGICKLPAGANVAGGYHPDQELLAAWVAEQGLPVGTPYLELTEAQQAAFRRWESHRQAERALSPEQQAVDFFAPLVRDLEAGLAKDRWARLPDADRYTLYHTALALVERIRPTLPAQHR